MTGTSRSAAAPGVGSPKIVRPSYWRMSMLIPLRKLVSIPTSILLALSTLHFTASEFMLNFDKSLLLSPKNIEK